MKGFGSLQLLHTVKTVFLIKEPQLTQTVQSQVFEMSLCKTLYNLTTGCFPGISQSRISHWLLQHGSDLSEQKKRAFYRWYTLEKTTPGTREPFHLQMLLCSYLKML